MNGTWMITRRVHDVVTMITRHPCLFLCSVLVCLAVGCAWYSCRGETISVFPNHWPLFHPKAKVHEITNGSLDTLSSFLNQHALKFVLFYAPWCGQSQNIVPDFLRAANVLHKEVTFIAINCWTGSCKQKNVLDSYPKLVAYHTNFPGVQYPDDYDFHSSYMIRFMQNIVRPFSFTASEKDLQQAKTTKQEVVLSYHDNLESEDYFQFFGVALSYVSQASRPFFGLVTDFNVAKKAGLTKHRDISFYRVFNPTLFYYPTLNTSIQNITDWISKNRKELIVELVPKATNKKALESQLSEKPAVILFMPLRRQKISSPLLTLYTQIATQYKNCSCVNTTKQETQNLENEPTKEPILQVNSQYIRPSRTRQDKVTKDEYLCASLVLTDKVYNRRNVCDICCAKGCHYHHGELFEVIRNRLRRNRFIMATACSSIRTHYYPMLRASVCCRGFQSSKHRKMEELRKAFGLTNDHILQQKLENLFDSIYYKVLKAIEPLQKDILNDEEDDKVLSGLEATKIGVNGKSIAPAAVSTDSNVNQPQNVSYKTTNMTNNTYDGCNRTGHVQTFHGASCYSNRSVNFFFMDSARFWSVAQRLGVKGNPSDIKNKVALMIVDVENEVYHVLDEELPVNNFTIVEFVMHFMNTRLKRTLRSADTPINSCPEPHACVLEVTSATLNDIVMDDDKNVLLVYYASWCGFCINLAPVLLTVARFFKDNKHVTIARMDADENDLPWQHTVASYPTIILYPAKRKDFSVPFPNESERTAESIIQFILKHETKAAQHTLFGSANGQCDSDVMNTKIDHLESSLRRVEREKQFLETRLESILMEKSLLGFKNSKLLKGMKVAQQSANRERDSRISMQTMYEQSEQSRSQVEEKSMTLLLSNAKLELEVTKLKGELLLNEQHSKTNMIEMRRLRIAKEDLEEMNELLVTKQEKTKETTLYFQNRDKLFARKVRRIHRAFKELYWKHRRNSKRNSENKQEINVLKEEKRLLSELLVNAEMTVKNLRTSLSSSDKTLEEERRQHTSVMEQNIQANQQLKEMKMNYEKLTVVLSQIHIPKEEQAS